MVAQWSYSLLLRPDNYFWTLPRQRFVSRGKDTRQQREHTACSNLYVLPLSEERRTSPKYNDIVDAAWIRQSHDASSSN